MSGENVTLDAENKKDAAVDQMKHDLGAGIRLQSGQAVGRQIQIPNSYIALDLETTGLNPKQDKIIEIGAVRVEAGQETGRFHTMLDPHRELETRITELTGITGDMLENAPDLVDILPGFLDFCGELPLLGHRIIFDYSFLKRAAVNQGLTFEKNGIDTLTMCRRFMPAEESKRLGAACAFYGLTQESAHRALGDALDAHRLYQKLVEKHAGQVPEAFAAEPLIYKVKREQPASKKQKEDLRYLLKYHKIDLPVQIDYLSRNEISRITDKIISKYGRISMKQT